MLQTGEAPSVLRKQVTSPGGTTEAALDVLGGNGGLGPLLRHAVAAAAARSRELGKG
jgi:pyrroline-5-carboxylate reductase